MKFRKFEEFEAEAMQDPELKNGVETEFMKQLPKRIAFRLAQIRKEKGVTQAALAQKIRNKQADIARFEKGTSSDVKLSTLIIIAGSLGYVLDFSLHPSAEVVKIAKPKMIRLNNQRKTRQLKKAA